jgi:hypothetical protein
MAVIFTLLTGKGIELPSYLQWAGAKGLNFLARYLEWAGICTLLAGKYSELPSYLEWAGICWDREALPPSSLQMTTSPSLLPAATQQLSS